MPQFNSIPSGAGPNAAVNPPSAGPHPSPTEKPHPTGELTLPASPNTTDPAVSISWLPAPLLPYLVALLPLRDANALAATAKRYSGFAASPEAVHRAACVSSLANFIQVEHDTRHAPPPVREAVLLRLAKQIARLPAASRVEACTVLARQVAQLPAASRPEVCAILASNMGHCSLQTLSSMLLALGADLLQDPAVLTCMAPEIQDMKTADALQAVADCWRMGDWGGERLPLISAAMKLSMEAQLQITMRTVVDSMRESLVRMRNTIAEKL
ncbi:hypothetical protein L602_000700001290 [Cupriavidus gilardii J11]|uniref:Uncharacterized protein n=1 Tax=Cupriavidus gilardii J11 TaxID=936133 RepID=A0A562B2G6_9BURK|nr:hypothetical protein [Cupriavidus gilardii]TWG79313.1 hypothetical protein L602_000700001290 [Cupriavidus gilardii J11]